MTSNKLIGNNIRRHRKFMGLTIKETAEFIGVHKQSLIRYENGRAPIRACDLYKLSNVLSVPISHFFSKDKNND